MKKLNRTFYSKTCLKGVGIALLLIVAIFQASAQKLSLTETELPTSKDARKKGMYVTTARTGENEIRTFIAYDLKKDGMGYDVMTTDRSGKLTASASEIADGTSEKKYNLSIPAPGKVKAPGEGCKALRLVTALGVLGKLKVEEGYFEPVYASSVDYGPYLITYTPVLRGFKFREGETYKSDTKINVFSTFVDPEKKIEKDYNIVENPFTLNTVGFMYADAQVALLGKDARFDKDSPYAQNVVVTGLFDGPSKEFKNLQQHVLDYNIVNVTDGYSADGNRAVLLSALNAPTTISAHKKYQADGVPYMTYITYDKNGNVKQNVTFKSKSIRGNFGVYGHVAEGAEYVLGSVNEGHDGYFRSDVGKPTHFQIIKLKDNAVALQKDYSYEELESKLVTPGGKKGKLKFKDIRFTGYETAPNGDILAFASTGQEYLVFQFDQQASLSAVYLIDRVPGKDLFEVGYQVMPSGNDIFLLYREQNSAIAQGVKKSYSRSSSSYAKNVNFSRVDEMITLGRVVKLSPTAHSCSEPVDFDEDVILGEEPMFEGTSGELLLPVRDTKRNYKLVAIR